MPGRRNRIAYRDPVENQHQQRKYDGVGQVLGLAVRLAEDLEVRNDGGERVEHIFLYGHLFHQRVVAVLIDEQLLREPISRELKGFLVLLKCRCLNSTNVCLYSGRKLADTLCLKKSRVNYYLNQAEELGYIKRKRNTITLTRDDIFIVTNETDIAQWKRFYPEVILDEDFDEHGKYIGHD